MVKRVELQPWHIVTRGASSLGAVIVRFGFGLHLGGTWEHASSKRGMLCLFPKQKEARLGVGFLLVFKRLPAPQPAKQRPQTGTCNPRATRQPPGSHPAAIGQPSGSHRAAIRQPSGSHRAAGVRAALCRMS